VDVSWRDLSCVQLWQWGLIDWVGVAPAETSQRIQALFSFCAAQQMAPHDLLQRACDGDTERAAVIAEAETAGVKLVVQSFLIHNGVNVHGALVCMPRTAEQLADQGWREAP